MSFFKPKHTHSNASSSHSSNTPFIGVRAKLNIGESNDKYEKEADAVADKVVQKKGLFGTEPFFAPAPTIQKADESEQDVQKSEETEQIQEKPIHDSITPLVQTKSEEEPLQAKEEEEPVQMMEEEPVQMMEEEPIQAKEEEEPVQMKEEEESVQTKSEEEPVQMMAEEEPVQAKEEEEPVQMKEEEESVQTKSEEEPVQMMAEEEPVQAKEEEEPVQMMEEEEAVQAKEEEPEVQKKESEDSEIQAKELPAIEPKSVQRKDDEIQEKEEEIQEKEGDEEIQRSSSVDTGDTSNLESNLASSKGGGSPMDSSTKSQMESGFGTDFSGVRIHNNSNAVQMNKELGAQAFTNGNDIYFNEGKYNPTSTEGQHLLAHELTHTVQQGASTQPAAQTKIQRAASAPQPADAPATKPTTPLDITHKLDLTDAWAKYLDAENSKKAGPREVDVKIGERFSGTIELSRKKGTDAGELAKYELTSGTKKNFLKINGWNFLQPLRDAGFEPVLYLNKFGDEQITTGFLTIAKGGVAVKVKNGFLDGLNANLDKMGFLGLSPIKAGEGFENTFEQGRLVFQVGAMTTVVDGFLEAGGGMGITGDTFTFNVNAKVDVAGLASGELMLARGEDGTFAGSADVEADIANVNAKIHVEYIEGAVTIQGSGKIQSEKFSGEITLLVTDKARSKEMMNAALGVEAMDAEKAQAESPASAPVAKSKGNQVLAGWGEVTANITPWLSGTAKVGIDSEGHVTIVGEITVPNEIELMEQRGKKVDIFKVEIRAGYGIPLVGQVFLFASIGMFMNAGFGPLVLKNVGFKGTYSTDPSVLQEFEVTGTLGINAFAILGLEAEAGVGVTILGHDLKAGVNVTAAAGLRAYAEATPTLQYKEQAAPEGGKMGETRLKGHFEAAAQLFLQLSGSLFYEIDSPWWSPAPDGREDFPLGEVQYPIGDSMGIGADMDWLVGSPEIPELKFSPVEFDPDKFTADVMADPPPGKKGKSDEEKPGQWEDKNKPSSQEKDPPETKDGKGLPESDKKKEDLKNLPDEQKYMRSLDEMSKLEKADPKPTLEVVKAKAQKVKAKYGIDSITVKDKKEEAEISVKHKKENNSKNILKVPLMSAAERYKLLKKAMDDLQVRNKQAGGKEGKISQEEAKTLIEGWKKANPVVEEVNVVDGGQTWDYFIDIGDKQNTQIGNSKKEGDNKKEGTKGEGNSVSVIGLSEKIEADAGHMLVIEGSLNKIKFTVYSKPKPLEDLIKDKADELEQNKAKDKDFKKKEKALNKIVDLKKDLDNEIVNFNTTADKEKLSSSNASTLPTIYRKVKSIIEKIAKQLEIVGVSREEWEVPTLGAIEALHDSEKAKLEQMHPQAKLELEDTISKNEGHFKAQPTLQKIIKVAKDLGSYANVHHKPLNTDQEYGKVVSESPELKGIVEQAKMNLLDASDIKDEQKEAVIDFDFEKVVDPAAKSKLNKDNKVIGSFNQHQLNPNKAPLPTQAPVLDFFEELMKDRVLTKNRANIANQYDEPLKSLIVETGGAYRDNLVADIQSIFNERQQSIDEFIAIYQHLDQATFQNRLQALKTKATSGKTITKTDIKNMFAGYEAHHVIPANFLWNNDTIKALIMDGGVVFNFNNLDNLIFIPKEIHLQKNGDGKYYWNHGEYNNAIESEINKKVAPLVTRKKYDAALTELKRIVASAKQKFSDVFIKGKSHIDRNDFFSVVQL